MTTLEADRLSFTAAICADPNDDTPRLVFADWLDEHDEPQRAEFIRVQIELAKDPTCILAGRKMMDGATPADCGGACDVCALRRRERELLGGSPGKIRFELSPDDPEWKYGFRKTVWAFGYGSRFPRVEPEFTRGFVSHVTCSAEDWLRHADALAWRPTQRARCWRCLGSGRAEELSRHSGSCGICGGTGLHPTNPRPCPATAQPIERVTMPFSPALLGQPNATHTFGASWPWIAFDVLPPHHHAGVTNVGFVAGRP